MSPLVARALQLAISQLQVREHPPGSNRGPEVDEYIRSVGLDPTKDAYRWCAAFVHWCFAAAARELGLANPVPRTGRAMQLAERAPWARVTAPAAGQVWVIDHGGGKGHAGFVERVTGPEIVEIVTVEGNTNPLGRREGDGVYERMRQPGEVFALLDFDRPRAG